MAKGICPVCKQEKEILQPDGACNECLCDIHRDETSEVFDPSPLREDEDQRDPPGC